MNFFIPIEGIDLSDMEVGIEDFPSLEKEIRRVAAQFIKGVLENNLHITLQPINDSKEMYAVVWSSLKAGWHVPVAEIKVTDLFLEYLNSEKANG